MHGAAHQSPKSLLFPPLLKLFQPTPCFSNDQAFGTEIDGYLPAIASTASQPIVRAEPTAAALTKRCYNRSLSGQSVPVLRKEPLDRVEALVNRIAFFHDRLALEDRRPHRDEPRLQRQLAQAEQGVDRRLLGAHQPQMAIDRLFASFSITPGRRWG